MTIEELQEQVAALQAEKEAVAKKNAELLAEVKKERSKSREIDADKYYAMVDELEAVKAENSKLNGELKLKGKEFEKLTATIGEKEATLQKLIIDDGLNNALVSAGVKPEFMAGAKALLRSQAQLKDNAAVIGDKPLQDFMTEWVAGDGKHYIAAANNSGSGAGGGSRDSGGQTVDLKSASNKAERIAAIEAKLKQG